MLPQAWKAEPALLSTLVLSPPTLPVIHLHSCHMGLIVVPLLFPSPFSLRAFVPSASNVLSPNISMVPAPPPHFFQILAQMSPDK